MLTLGAIALAVGYLLCAAVCRACNGYGDAQAEISRDREWWRGLAETPADEPSTLAEAAE